MPGREEEKRRKRNITLLPVSGVWQLFHLEHFSIYGEIGHRSTCILKVPCLFSHFRAKQAWLRPVACGQLGEMRFCWVDSKHLMSAKHFPLQLELQHMAFVSAKPRGSRSSTQPSCALTTGMAALICSDTWYTVRTWMESIIACPHIWLRIHLAIALLTGVPFIWL